MSKRRKKHQPPAPARFQVGDRVRVKQGILDPDYPDMPLGGWAGTITEVHRRGRYTIRWSRETLATIHPVYGKRCERDGMVLEEYWLGDDDLEADPGGPLAIVQPGEITPKPLSAKNQDDRARMVFGLTSDDLPPRPDQETLETYYDYLDEKLSFPFEARYREEDSFFDPSPARRLTVVALGSEPADLDEDDGIFCEIETAEGEHVLPLANLELHRSDPNRQLVDDYVAWFVGELVYEDDDYGDDEEEEFDGDEEEEDDLSGIPLQKTWLDVAKLLLQIITFAVFFGAVVGSAVVVMPWAKWGACIGGALLGVFEAVARARSAQREWFLIVPRFRKALGGVVGAIAGAVEGAFFGIMAVAFIGALAGGIVGALLKRHLVRRKKKRALIVPGGGVLIAAACGVTAQAFYRDHAQATEGLLYGALAGLACGLFLCLVALPLAFLTVRRP
jgi:uncharacterized protein YodC (DUF2158 family)